ncbi:MAG: ATP-dependent zinc metalloprotease FtsH [Sorangiineae bacterium]|nr:ATP-dependent zinc metalloprotease FtsH [Polyangiaceae bacterium]MEB2322181.1 ATP-dependent zinc metalloprotease FtsH [Sorangiineae bacterium]
MKQPHKTLLLWVVLIVAFLALWQFLSPDGPQKQPMPFSEFIALVNAPADKPHVDAVEIKDREYSFTIKNPGAKGGPERGVAIGPQRADRAVEELLAKPNLKVTYQKDEASPILTSALTILLPMVFLLVMFYLFMRQLQAGGGKAMSFGKSRARLLNESQNKVTFADVAGIDEARDEVEEIIAFLKDPKKFQRLGGRIPKGVLMMGPPGTGKTLLARAIAGEAGVPFFSISGSDFVEMFVGVGASRVRDLFEQGKKHAPCIIFIDEIDAVGRHRGAGLGGGHDEREQTLNQLLVEMDGFESNEGVIIIAATNRPDVLDPAILRPGRFDRRITVPRPDIRGREGILGVHTKKVPLATDVDLRTLAAGTPGFVGADLENLVNEAALLAARQDKDAVGMVDFELAKDKVLMGSERRSMVMSDPERRVAAWHESGHTLVGKLIEGNDAVHKVSIIPRGAALGVTQFLPTEDRHLMTKKQTLARIAMALGGRVAEEVVFGEITTGAQDDIKRATRVARAMVCELGMTDRLGPVAYGDNEESVFIGREMTSRREDYSEETAREIDQEIRAIVEGQYKIVRELISGNRDKLDRLAEALLQRETLDAEEIEAALDGRELPARQRVVIPSWSDKQKAAREKKRPASIFGAPKPAPSA